MLKGSGFFPKPSPKEIIFITILIVTLGSSKISYYLILLPITIAYVLYTPVGLTFGAPSYAYIASLFATSIPEGKEFLSQLPLKNYCIAFSILFAIIFFRKITKKYKINFLKNRTFVILSIIFSLLSLAPFKFFDEVFNESKKVKKELEKLNKSYPSEWGRSTLSAESKYDDYILVIGESARKDYHNAYGYPVSNTPFMSNANGILIDGFTAGGSNTVDSLRLLLTKPNTKKWEPNYNLNFVDLIKSAGIKTYWISNQGYLGTFDTPISSIAKRSDEKKFFKYGESNSKNTSDIQLIPEFKNIIMQPTKSKRFIVLHLYGSHPYVCHRVEDFPKIFDEKKIMSKYREMNCYISSIKKTDKLLEDIYSILTSNKKENNRNFSMIYISDHGLYINEEGGTIKVNNSKAINTHYNIPLFKISSDDTERKVYTVFKSGLNFTDGIGNWIGINNPKLNNEVNLFSNKNDPDDYGLQKRLDKLPPSPTILIPTE